MKNWLNPPRGHGEYRVVPFCLTNATAVCQARVNYVPRDPLNTCVFVYPDDLLIVRRVEVSVSVLQRPGETTLKAEMFLSSLGFIASQCWTGLAGESTATLPKMVQSNYKSYGGLG